MLIQNKKSGAYSVVSEDEWGKMKDRKDDSDNRKTHQSWFKMIDPNSNTLPNSKPTEAPEVPAELKVFTPEGETEGGEEMTTTKSNKRGRT